MAKQLVFENAETTYTLEFTRKTVADMERNGFIAEDILRKPMTTLPALFAGAFLAHHRKTKPETIEMLFDKLSNKDELVSKLAEMYNEPLIELMDEPEAEEAKLDWTVTW